MDNETITAVLAWASAALVVLTPLVWTLEKAAEAWLIHAHSTPGTEDDAQAEAAVVWAHRFSGWVDMATRFLPTIRMGGNRTGRE